MDHEKRTFRQQLGAIDGRFELHQEIARSRFSRVFAAVDRTNGQEVALKLIEYSALHSENLIRFQMEIDALARIDDPGIVRIYAGGITETTAGRPHAFVAMELVPGQTLDAFCRHPLPVAQSVDLMAVICRAVAAVHARNIIHGDLKPANLMVTGVSPAEIKLIDFGLSRFKRALIDEPEDLITGTLQYMAPEQIGLLHRPVDERSDLYSLGLIFYQLLSGRFPFDTRTLSRLLHAQIALTPPAPSTYNKKVDVTLDRIVARLLSKEPSQRYKNAPGLLHDLERFLDEERGFQLGAADAASQIRLFTRFIGRITELESLRRRHERLTTGEGCLCFVIGPAGSGKTRLVEELRQDLLKADRGPIEGRCVQGSGQKPWRLFTAIMSEYTKGFRRHDTPQKNTISAALKQQFRDVGRVLIDLQPHLQDVLGSCPPLTRLAPEQEAIRISLVAATFIGALSTAEGGLVVILEDLHWSDRSSLAIFSELARLIRNLPLLVVATVREEEVSANPDLQALLADKDSNPAKAAVRLAPLDLTAITELVTDALDGDPEVASRLAGYVYRRSHGNPLHAIALLAHLAEHGIIKRAQGNWVLDRDGLETASIPEALMDILLDNLGQLRRGDKQVLGVAAAIGKSVALDLWVQVAQSDADRVWQALARALRRGVMEEISDNPGQVAFVHDRIRDVFYRRLASQARGNIHNRIGEALEIRHQASTKAQGSDADALIFDIAHHFITAQNGPKIRIYAYPAACAANKAFAYQEAIRYLHAAIGVLERERKRVEDSTLLSEWLIVRRDLAETYINAGRAKDALAILPELLSLNSDRQAKRALYLLQMRAYIGDGRFSESEQPARAGLRLLGERLPVGAVGIVAGTLRQLAGHFLPAFGTALGLHPRPTAVESAKRKFAFYFHLFWTYHTDAAWKVPRPILRMYNLSRRKIGPSRELGLALQYYALLCIILSRHKRALSRIEKARSIAVGLKDEWLLAGCDKLLHTSLCVSGQYAASIAPGRKGFSYFSRTGEFRESLALVQGICFAYHELGQMDRALAFFQQAAGVARNRTERFLIDAFGFPAVVYIDIGEFDKAEQYLRPLLAIDGDLSEHQFGVCRNTMVMGRLYSERREMEKSLAYFETADQVNRASNFIQYLLIPLYYYHAEALLMHYRLHQDLLTPIQKRQRLAQAKRLCAKARRKSRVSPTHYGCAMLVTAEYWKTRGRAARAQKWYDRAIAQFRRYGQRYKLARALFARGCFLEAGHAHGLAKEGAKQTFEEAYRLFTEIDVPFWQHKAASHLGLDSARVAPGNQPLDRAKRDVIISFGRDLAGISDLTEIMGMILAQGMELTGAQAGGLFLCRPDSSAATLQASRNLATDQPFTYSQGIVDEVFETGRVLLTTDARAEQHLDLYASVAREGLKSILCLPIRHNELVNGVCYLHNPLVRGLFTQNDRRYMEFLLSPAAVAIENALLQRKLAAVNPPPPSDRPSSPDAASNPKLVPVLAHLQVNFHDEVSRDDLAALAGISPDYLGKLFKSQVGKSIRNHVNELRLQYAVKQLAAGDMKIVDIAFAAGFDSLRTFNRLFQRAMGDTPSSYRKKIRARAD